jgi:molybdopterin/thiamine biosynthesis adenylyltransferase
MSSDSIRISVHETSAESEDRFHRFRLMGWWDQDRLARAKVLVVGAGALGNEIIKNLSLLGIGNILVLDMDRIENSNLSRSVLYRKKDNGEYKAEVAARAAKEIYPDANVHFLAGNIIHDVGMGVFRWADIVLGGLDNREARLAINRHCFRVNRPWIDGAIEQIEGMARMFVPDGPCYECTMSETDWKLLQMRRSCNLLSREEMEGGKTPTTPTISSIIAGVQCQEAVKYLHGTSTLAGKGWVFQGQTADSWTIEYQRKEECYSHDLLDEVVSLGWGVGDCTAADLLSIARDRLGAGAKIEFARDMVEKLVCPKCSMEQPVFASLSQLKHDIVFCPHCPETRREVVTFYSVSGDEQFLDKPLGELGVPPFDIIIARNAAHAIGLELTGDAANTLGPLAVSSEELELE